MFTAKVLCLIRPRKLLPRVATFLQPGQGWEARLPLLLTPPSPPPPGHSTPTLLPHLHQLLGDVSFAAGDEIVKGYVTIKLVWTDITLGIFKETPVIPPLDYPL